MTAAWSSSTPVCRRRHAIAASRRRCRRRGSAKGDEPARLDDDHARRPTGRAAGASRRRSRARPRTPPRRRAGRPPAARGRAGARRPQAGPLARAGRPGGRAATPWQPARGRRALGRVLLPAGSVSWLSAAPPARSAPAVWRSHRSASSGWCSSHGPGGPALRRPLRRWRPLRLHEVRQRARPGTPAKDASTASPRVGQRALPTTTTTLARVGQQAHGRAVHAPELVAVVRAVGYTARRPRPCLRRRRRRRRRRRHCRRRGGRIRASAARWRTDSIGSARAAQRFCVGSRRPATGQPHRARRRAAGSAAQGDARRVDVLVRRKVRRRAGRSCRLRPRSAAHP